MDGSDGVLSLEPFFITGLPRSRTAWMAAFLSGAGVMCWHELLKHCATREAFYRGMRHPEYRVGDSDCGLPVTDFQARFPKAKTVVIERDPVEVLASLHDLGFGGGMEHMTPIIDALSKVKGLRVPFDRLDEMLPDVCGYLEIPYCKAKHDNFRPLSVETFDYSSANLEIWR